MPELLPQGAGFAATAVEKIFKAFIRGKKGRWASQNGLHKLSKELSAGTLRTTPDFLEFLIVAYDLRYLDNLSHGHSIVISKYRTLAEIDRTMCTIFSGMAIEQSATFAPSV
ncbi:MAG: hypothetical protein U1F42_06165 [Candidatus Competibacteraceae bacterium]